MMIKPIIGRKALLPIMTCGALMLGACNNGKNNNFVETSNDKYVREVQKQSYLDSLFYRNKFNTTHLARYANAVKDFNEIAAKTSLKNAVSEEYSKEFNQDRCIDRMLELINGENWDEDVIENMKNKCLEIDNGHYDLRDYQRIIDDIYYENFFDRYI